MGSLTYAGSLTIEFDDRVLAHLQLIVGAKLRRGESFYFSWNGPADAATGRRTVWLNPTIPLVFEYEAERMPTVNRAWVDVLTVSANSAGGLQLVPEPIAHS